MWNAVRDTAETQRDGVSRTPLCTTEPESSKAHPARRTASMSKKARWLHREVQAVCFQHAPQCSAEQAFSRSNTPFCPSPTKGSPQLLLLTPVAVRLPPTPPSPNHCHVESASCGWHVPTSLGGSRERRGPGRSGQYDLSEGHPSTPTTCHQVRGSIVGFSEFLKRSQKCSFFLTEMSLI